MLRQSARSWCAVALQSCHDHVYLWTHISTTSHHDDFILVSLLSVYHFSSVYFLFTIIKRFKEWFCLQAGVFIGNITRTSRRSNVFTLQVKGRCIMLIPFHTNFYIQFYVMSFLIFCLLSCPCLSCLVVPATHQNPTASTSRWWREGQSVCVVSQPATQ